MFNKNSYTVYILRCVDNSLYTGIARDLAARLKTHTHGKGSKYVRARLPFSLVYQEICKNRSLATKREIAIKRMNKEEKEKLISSRTD